MGGINMDEHFKKVSNSVARLETALCERSFDKAIKINLAAMQKYARHIERKIEALAIAEGKHG